MINQKTDNEKSKNGLFIFLLTVFSIISCSASKATNEKSWILEKRYSIETIFNGIDKVEKNNHLDYKAACSYAVLLKVGDESYQPITPLPNSFLDGSNGSASLVQFLSEGDVAIYLGESSKKNCQDVWFNLESKDLSTAEAHFLVHEYFHFVYQGRAVKNNIPLSMNWRPTEVNFFSKADQLNKEILSLYRRQRDSAGDTTKFCSYINDWNALMQRVDSTDFSHWNSMMQGFEWPADYFSWQVLNELGLSETKFIRLAEDTDTLSHVYGTPTEGDREDSDREWTSVDLFPNQYLFAALIATASSYPLKQNQTLSEQMAAYKTPCQASSDL